MVWQDQVAMQSSPPVMLTDWPQDGLPSRVPDLPEDQPYFLAGVTDVASVYWSRRPS